MRFLLAFCLPVMIWLIVYFRDRRRKNEADYSGLSQEELWDRPDT